MFLYQSMFGYSFMYMQMVRKPKKAVSVLDQQLHDLSRADCTSCQRILDVNLYLKLHFQSVSKENAPLTFFIFVIPIWQTGMPSGFLFHFCVIVFFVIDS